MTIFDIPIETETYSKNCTHITTFDVLTNENEFIELPQLNMIGKIAEKDDADLEESRISFNLNQKEKLKCFVCLKPSNMETKEGGIKITSIGYSSLYALEDMLNQIVYDYKDQPYQYIWFEKTQEPFIVTDFYDYGFKSISNRIFVKEIKKH